MVKRGIGIDIGPSYLRAVQVANLDGQNLIEKVFVAKTRRSKDSLPQIIDKLSKSEGFDKKAPVAIAVSQSRIFFRTIQLSKTDLDHILSQDTSSLKHNFPLDTDKSIIEVYNSENLTHNTDLVLAGAATKEDIEHRTDLFKKSQFKIQLIDAPILAAHATLNINYPETKTARLVLIYIDESCMSIALSIQSRIVLIRNIPLTDTQETNLYDEAARILPSELQITWQKVFNDQLDDQTGIFLTGSSPSLEEFLPLFEESLNRSAAWIDSFRNIKCQTDSNHDTSVTVAEGLALRLLNKNNIPGINFIRAYSQLTQKEFNTNKELTTIGALIAAIIIVAVLGISMQLWRLERKHSHIQQQIEQVFRSTLPKENNIVNPAAQMQQKLLIAQNELNTIVPGTGSCEPLDILHKLTETIPNVSGINIDNILITGSSARITGSANTFEELYNWQKVLQKVEQFSEVDVQNPYRDQDGGQVHFTVITKIASIGNL